jgi:hypothetical protein
MANDDLEDDLRLYLGPSRSASLIEVVVIVRGSGRSELAIHAMPMRESTDDCCRGSDDGEEELWTDSNW